MCQLSNDDDDDNNNNNNNSKNNNNNNNNDNNNNKNAYCKFRQKLYFMSWVYINKIKKLKKYKRLHLLQNKFLP